MRRLGSSCCCGCRSAPPAPRADTRLLLCQFFCRGGDIKFLHEKAKNSATRAQALAYFREEYLLSHLIASYTKPVRQCCRGFVLAAVLTRLALQIAMQLNGEVLGTSLSMLGLVRRASQLRRVYTTPR